MGDIWTPDETRPQAPIYAEPGKMPPDVIEELGKRSQTFRNDARKVAQHNRWSVLNSQHQGLINTRLASLYRTDIKKEIAAHISTAMNPAADIVSAVCQVYRHGAVRRVQGASKEQADAFFELSKETGISALAPGWNDSGYFVGPQLIMPQIVRERLRLVPIEQYASDIVQDALDPFGDPVAVAYRIADERSGASMCVLDGWGWRYFEVKHGRVTEVEAVEHNLGDLPAGVLRFMPVRDPTDWHTAGMHKRLCDGSIDVGRVYATMQFVRRTQNHWAFVALGNINQFARGQNLGDPEKPIIAKVPERVSVNNNIKIDTLPFDTDPGNFMKEIRFTIEAMAESTGVPVTVDTIGAGVQSKADFSFDENALSELRTAQTWWAQEFERRLWTSAVALAKSKRHRLADKLPPSEMVEETFTLELAPMHRTFSDPKVEHEHWEWLFRHGMASKMDLARRRYGQLKDSDLEKKIDENLEINGKWVDEVTKRNMNVDAEDDKIVTAAEANGAMGPKVRDGKKPPPNKDE